MRVKDGSTVSLTYVLTDDKGAELDRADASEPFTYTHGAGEIVPGLEKAMANCAVGDTKKVVVPAAEGYGIIDPKLRFHLKREVFPKDQKIQTGMSFVAQNPDGSEGLPFTIIAVDADRVMVDGNHPLAGKTLHFDVKVVKVE